MALTTTSPLVLALAIGCLSTGALSLSAQAGPGDERPAWSPLDPIADLPRNAGAGEVVPRFRLLDPTPSIGLFSFARNPAGLPADVGTRWGGLDMRATSMSGAYRRPLDPGESVSRGGRAYGWQPAGGSSALAGSFSFDEVSYPKGTSATTFAPYTSSPFVVTDTSVSPNRLLRARLNGAIGWHSPRLGLGVAAGYESIEGHSREALIPRRHSFAMPGLAVGVLLRMSDDRVAIGLAARGHQVVEISQVANAQRGEPFIRRLNGFATPELAIIDRGSYYRRREVEAGAVSLAGLAHARGWSIAVDLEAGHLDEAQFSQRVADPLTDEWSARAVSAFVVVQRSVRSDIVMSGHLGGSRVRGEARLAGSDSVIFRSVESALLASLEVRHETSRVSWSGWARVGIRVETRDRGDTLQDAVRTRIDSRQLELEAQVSRRLSGTISIAGLIAQYLYSPRGSIPATTLYPAAIRDLAAPATAYLATPASRRQAGILAQFTMTPITAIRVHAWNETLSPVDTAVQIEDAPTGSRTTWGVSIGIVFGESRLRE